MSDLVALAMDDVPPRRLDEYFGLWSIESMRFSAAFDRVRSMDMGAHVRATQRPVLRSQRYETTVSAAAIGEELKSANYKDTGGYGYPEVPMGDARVAVIQLSGVLMKQVSSLDDGTSTVMARRDIRHAAQDSKIDAILLLVDSPGGSVSGTEGLASEILAAAAAKPCYAQVEDLCASAAYWAASCCTKIFASGPTALIGSIGTYACLYDMSAAAAMDGIKVKLYSTGPLKGAGTPGTAITPEQDAYFQKIVDDTQVHFAAAVAANRKLPQAKLDDVTTGAVFMAKQSIAMGLLDGIQPIEQTLSLLGAAAKRTSKTSTQTNKAAASAAVTPNPKEDAVMSDPTPGAAAAPPPPRAATLTELKAALPKSNAEFREKCLEKGSTIQEAQAAFIAEQQDQIDELQAKARPAGVAALATRAAKAGVESLQGKLQIQTRCEELRKSGMPRHTAYAQACRENPEARMAMVEEHNAEHGRKAVPGQY